MTRPPLFIALLILFAGPARAALSPDDILMRGIPCEALPAQKLPAEQVKSLGRMGAELEVCSSVKDLTTYDLQQISTQGGLILYVTDPSRTSYDLQNLASQGAELRILDQDLKNSQISVKKWLEMGTAQKPGKLKVFISSGDLSLSDLKDLAKSGAQLHINWDKFSLPQNELVEVAQLTRGGIFIYTKGTNNPEIQLQQLRAVGAKIKLLN